MAQEETDKSLSSLAWREFQHSPVVHNRHADEDVHIVPGNGDDDDKEVRQARCELKTCISVPSWCSLSHYGTVVDPDSFRLVHKSTCNFFSCNVNVPLLIPRAEIFDPGSDSKEDGSRNKKKRRSMGRGGGGGHEAAASLERIQSSIRLDPVMPAGWYKNNLIGARIHSIDVHRNSSMLACEMLDGRLFR